MPGAAAAAAPAEDAAAGVRAAPGLVVGDFFRIALPARGLKAAAAAAAAAPKMKLKPLRADCGSADGAGWGWAAAAAGTAACCTPRFSCWRSASLSPCSPPELLAPLSVPPRLSLERRSSATEAGPGLGVAVCSADGGAWPDVGVADPGTSGVVAPPKAVEASAGRGSGTEGGTQHWAGRGEGRRPSFRAWQPWYFSPGAVGLAMSGNPLRPCRPTCR